MPRFFNLTASLALILTACDPDADESEEVQVVAVGEPAGDEDQFMVLAGDASDEHGLELLDLAVKAPEDAPEESSNALAQWFCTSGDVHCTKITLQNSATMIDGKTVKITAIAHHDNDHVDFAYTRMEHWVLSYDGNAFYGIGKKVNPGDWATKYGRGYNLTLWGADGYTVVTRLCFNVNNDGEGELCTAGIGVKAVW